MGTIESGTGATMVASGTTITTVGLVAEGPSLGTSTVVVVVGSADATVGAGLTVHGAVMMSNARKISRIRKVILQVANNLLYLNIVINLQVKRLNLEMVRVGKIKMEMCGKRFKT